MAEHVPHHRALVDATMGGLHVHADVQLRAPWTILFGPSGSGKTTLLRALCGLLPAEAAVDFDRFDGNDWQPLDHLSPHRRGLAYMPQHGAVFPHLTVRQNLIFAVDVRPHAPTRSPNNPGRRLVDEAIALFDLQPLLDRKPQGLSGGELRRVALARAFAVPNTRLMLLDEPFTGLDRAQRDNLILRLKEALASRSIPVISVTHDTDEAYLLDAEVIRIAQGQVTGQGPVREVLQTERLRLLEALQ